MTSPLISLKTKSRIASADILAADVMAQWWELADNRELDTIAGDGARGGIVLDENGQLRWEAIDKNGNQIAHVERKRDCVPSKSSRISYEDVGPTMPARCVSDRHRNPNRMGFIANGRIIP